MSIDHRYESRYHPASRINWVPKDVAERAATSFEVVRECHVSTLKLNEKGYAVVEWRDLDGRQRVMSAARAAWTHFHGHPSPTETVDHKLTVCSDRRCVRREHLRLLSAEQNSARQMQARDWPIGRCKRGHRVEKATCRACVHDVEVDKLLGYSTIESAQRLGLSSGMVSRYRRYAADGIPEPKPPRPLRIDDPLADDHCPELPLDPVTLGEMPLRPNGWWAVAQ